MKTQYKVFIAIAVAMLAIGCKIQDAPGAYAQAQGKVDKQKVEKLEEEEVAPIPMPAKIKRKIVSNSKSVRVIDSADLVVNEPSAVVERDPEIYVPEKDTVSETIEKAAMEAVENAKEPVEEPKVEENTRKEKFDVVNGQGDVKLKAYNVVVGSFGKEENAKRLKEQLKPEYDPVVVVNSRGMFRVILISYDTYGEAKSKIGDIVDEFPDAWCLVQI